MHIPELTGGPPTIKNPNLHWVETVDGGAKVRFVVYSKSIWEVWTHYNGRTKPCFENHDFCEGGHDEETLRWYGFVFGWFINMGKRGFMQLTAGAARQWLEQVAAGVPLRGMSIEVARTARKQGRLSVKVERYQSQDVEKLGQDCCPKESIFRMWKVKHVPVAYNLSLVGGPDDIPAESKTG